MNFTGIVLISIMVRFTQWLWICFDFENYSLIVVHSSVRLNYIKGVESDSLHLDRIMIFLFYSMVLLFHLASTNANVCSDEATLQDIIGRWGIFILCEQKLAITDVNIFLCIYSQTREINFKHIHFLFTAYRNVNPLTHW